MNCDSIRQKILNLDYSINPSMLTLLVPGLSLVIRKIQTTDLLNRMTAAHYRPEQLICRDSNPEFTKWDKVHKYHFAASLIQTIALIALSKLLPLLIVLAIPALYELYTSGKGLTRREITWTPHSVQIRH